MDSGNVEMESISIANVSRATVLSPSSSQLRPESASWNSQWPTFIATPIITASANSAPAMLSSSSFFETVQHHGNNSVTLDDMERYVLEATMPSLAALDKDTLTTSSPLRQDPMSRSIMPETHMPFSMDNDGDMFLDHPDFVMIPFNSEPAFPSDSQLVLFSPLDSSY